MDPLSRPVRFSGARQAHSAPLTSERHGVAAMYVVSGPAGRVGRRVGLSARRSRRATARRLLVAAPDPAANGSAGRPLSFSWKRKADDRRATLPLRTRARVIEVVALGEDTSLVTASVRLDVTQGQARQVVVSLPPGVIVNQVAGAMVGDWTTDAGTLTVTLLEPAATEVSVVINAETRAPREGTVTVPLLRVPSAERETGGVAVDVVGPGEMPSPVSSRALRASGVHSSSISGRGGSTS